MSTQSLMFDISGYAQETVFNGFMFEQGMKRIMKQMILEACKCPHWKRYIQSMAGDSATTQLLKLKKHMDMDPLLGASPCGDCDERRRAIQVLHFLNVMASLNKIWAPPYGFDPRREADWETLTVKGTGRNVGS